MITIYNKILVVKIGIVNLKRNDYENNYLQLFNDNIHYKT